MQLSALLWLLPLLVAADQQPLKEKAKGWADTGAAYMADQLVQPITRHNWEQTLAPNIAGEHEWLLYVTGGNKSCYGRCGNVDKAWNLAVPVIKALPSCPRLGFLDCEKEDILCTAWSANLPTLWHFDFPRKPISASVPTPQTPLRIVALNISTTTAEDIINVVRDKAWQQQEEYTGVLHPVDGLFRKYGILVPFGWFMWGFGSTPSWLIMIAISFFSRQYMTRKAMRSSPGMGDNAARPPTAAQAQPAAQPAAKPAGGGGGGGRGGGGKKRK